MNRCVTVADLERVMLIALDLAESVQAILGRELLPTETAPFRWVVDAIDLPHVRAETAAMPNKRLNGFMALMADFHGILGKSSDKVSRRQKKGVETCAVG